MDFTKTVPVIIPGIFSSAVVYAFVPIAPFIQSVIDAVLISVYQRSRHHRGFYQWLDGFLPHIGC
jgi:hypothetical protein